MKRLFNIISAAIVSTAFIGSVTSAQEPQTGGEQCTKIVITNTGPNSNNQGICNVVYDAKVTCVNNKYVLTQNDQTAVTGEAELLGNTTANTAISGTARNESKTEVTIGASCGEGAKTAAAQTPGMGSVGGGVGQAGGGQGAAGGIEVLPDTDSTPAATIVAVSVAVAAGAAAASRLGVAAYRRFVIK